MEIVERKRKNKLYFLICILFIGVAMYVIARQAEGWFVSDLWKTAVFVLWAAVVFASFAMVHGKLSKTSRKCVSAITFSSMYAVGLLVFRAQWRSLLVNQAFRSDPLPLRVFLAETLLIDGASGAMRYVYAFLVFLLTALIWVAVCRFCTALMRKLKDIQQDPDAADVQKQLCAADEEGDREA